MNLSDEVIDRCLNLGMGFLGLGAAAIGTMAAGATGTVLAGGAIIGWAFNAKRKHAIDSAPAIARIRRKLTDKWKLDSENGWADRTDIDAACAALAAHLPECMLDAQALAKVSLDRAVRPFPDAATELVLMALEDRSELFRRSSIAREFAKALLEQAFEQAIEDEAYFRKFEPHVLITISGGVGETLSMLSQLDSKVDTLQSDLNSVSSHIETMSDALAPSLVLQQMSRPLTANQVHRLPTAVLVAEYRSVPYVDIAGLCGSLQSWAQSDEELVSGRLLVGGAGVGKTRLAIEALASLDHIWQTGFVPRSALSTVDWNGNPDSTTRLRRFFENCDGRPIFLVVDYAETRRFDIQRLVQSAALYAKGKVRVLLLARDAGEWWDQLRRESREVSLTFSAEPEAAGPPTLGNDSARQLFRSAASAFANILQECGSEELIDSSWDNRELPAERISKEKITPLELCIEAFLYVRGVQPHASPAEEMVREERRHWCRGLGLDPSSPSVTEEPILLGLQRCATITTLLQPDAIVSDVGIEAEVDAVLSVALDNWPTLGQNESERHRRYSSIKAAFLALYRHVADAGYRLSPILPDLVGEACIGNLMGDGTSLVLDLVDASASHYQHWSSFSTVSVLDRTTREVHAEHVRKAAFDALSALLQKRTKLMLPALLEVARIQDGDTFRILRDGIPTLDSSELMRIPLYARANSSRLGDLIILAASESLARDSDADTLRGDETSRLRVMAKQWLDLDPAEGATFLYNRMVASLKAASELLTAGQVDKSARFGGGVYDIITDSDIRKRLSPVQLLRILHDLAHLLTSSERVDLAEEVLEFAREAFNQLDPSTDQTIREIHLSMGSRQISYLMHTHRIEEAIKLGHSLVEAYEAEPIPASAEEAAALGMAYHALSGALSADHRNVEAAKKSKRAAELLDAAAGESPDEYRSLLGAVLDDYGSRLCLSGNWEEGIHATRRGLSIRRQICKDAPESGKSDLSMSLHNLAARLMFSEDEVHKQISEAEAHLDEAISIRRELASSDQFAFKEHLANSYLLRCRSAAQRGDLPGVRSAAQMARDTVSSLSGLSPLKVAHIFTSSYMAEMSACRVSEDFQGAIDSGCSAVEFLAQSDQLTTDLAMYEQTIVEGLIDTVVNCVEQKISVTIPNWLADLVQRFGYERSESSQSSPEDELPADLRFALGEFQKARVDLQHEQSKDAERRYDKARSKLRDVAAEYPELDAAKEIEQQIFAEEERESDLSDVTAYEDSIDARSTPLQWEGFYLFRALVLAQRVYQPGAEREAATRAILQAISALIEDSSDELSEISKLMSKLPYWGPLVGIDLGLARNLNLKTLEE